MAGAIHYRDTDLINNIPVDINHPLPVQILEPTTSTDDAGPSQDVLAKASAELIAANRTNELLYFLLQEISRQTLLLKYAFNIEDDPETLDRPWRLP